MTYVCVLNYTEDGTPCVVMLIIIETRAHMVCVRALCVW